MPRQETHAQPLPDSLWANSACPTPTTHSLIGEHHSDIVVIGGGFTGFSTALHLALAGRDVMVLEANEIGFGGSGRNVGLANAGLWTKPDEIESILGQSAGRKLFDALSRSPDLVYSLIERHGIDCEATRNGTLHLAHSRLGLKDLEDRTAQLNLRGSNVELLDAATTEQMTGTRGHLGAILDRRAGTIQPLSYVRGLAKASIDNGARVFHQTPVTELTPKPNNTGWLITTPSATVHAQTVVLATNAYSTGLWQGVQESFVPLFFSQFATAPLSKETLEVILPGKQGCWDTRQVMTSLRLDQSGRLILGTVGKTAHLGSGLLEAWASDQLKKLFPHIPISRLTAESAESPWAFSWSGKIAYSDDHLPHLHLLAPNLITCLGYSGRGIGPGTVMGKEIAEFINGKPMEELPLPFTEPSKIFARTVREQYYTRGSDVYHLCQRIA
jgi:glycine/D-amino acid oxidase-like deaminating enzyme